MYVDTYEIHRRDAETQTRQSRKVQKPARSKGVCGGLEAKG